MMKRSVAGIAILLMASAFAEDAPVGTADVVAYLARSIEWYRHVTAIQESALQASDILARDNAQRTATRALQLAFDFARAAAPVVETASSPAGKAPVTGTSAERAMVRAVERVANIEARIAEVDAALGKAGGQARPNLMARRKELAAELKFAEQIKASVQGLRTFLSSQSTGGASLLGFVDRLERSVPEAARGAQPQPPVATASAASEPFRPESSGIFALAMETIGMARLKSQLDDTLSETDSLRKKMDQLRAPLVSEITNAVRRSDTVSNDSASQDATQMEADRREIEALSARFQQVSAVLVPLREHGLQIEVTRGSLVEQRNSAQQRYTNAGRYLIFRVLGLILTIVVVLAISELWRRGTFRYVRDVRRRRQFLLLRRIVVGFVVAGAVVMGLVNEVGSLATYAGFLTAGLAVALQNVITSVVAYFFLIGRYGLRVGDRVTISGVCGDVLEIGLVRLYLMEMTGEGEDLHATGRVVGFSNSVLFQPAALFRQMPGTDYVWHSAVLTVAPDTDMQFAEGRLMEAVDAVYEPYRERLEQQHAAFQRLVDVPVTPPKPVARVRFTKDGLEFLVRYPAETAQASETDGRILNALAEAVAHEPRLQLAGSRGPRVQGNN